MMARKKQNPKKKVIPYRRRRITDFKPVLIPLFLFAFLLFSGTGHAAVIQWNLTNVTVGHSTILGINVTAGTTSNTTLNDIYLIQTGGFYCWQKPSFGALAWARILGNLDLNISRAFLSTGGTLCTSSAILGLPINQPDPTVFVVLTAPNNYALIKINSVEINKVGTQSYLNITVQYQTTPGSRNFLNTTVGDFDGDYTFSIFQSTIGSWGDFGLAPLGNQTLFGGTQLDLYNGYVYMQMDHLAATVQYANINFTNPNLLGVQRQTVSAGLPAQTFGVAKVAASFDSASFLCQNANYTNSVVFNNSNFNETICVNINGTAYKFANTVYYRTLLNGTGGSGFAITRTSRVAIAGLVTNATVVPTLVQSIQNLQGSGLCSGQSCVWIFIGFPLIAILTFLGWHYAGKETGLAIFITMLVIGSVTGLLPSFLIIPLIVIVAYLVARLIGTMSGGGGGD